MKADVLIVGGGMTGLGVGIALGIEGWLFEADHRVGGCVRSDYVEGYTVDRTGHLLHFRDSYVKRLLFEEGSIEWLHFKRNAEIHISGRKIPYPIQYHLHALPEKLRVECLESYLRNLDRQPNEHDSFDRWSRSSYGDALHELFFAPYNRKLWQTDLGGITAEWAANVVPAPDHDRMLRGATGEHIDVAVGYNASFSYPTRGGSGAIAEDVARRVRIPISTGVEVISIDPAARTCELSNGDTVQYRALVSILPLAHLISKLHRADSRIRALAETLRHNSVFYFAFGYRTGGVSPLPHWVYIPESHFLMYRVGILSNYSPNVAPPGSILLCAEIGFPQETAVKANPSDLRGRVLADLDALGLVQPDWTLEFEHHGCIECAYAIFDDARRTALPVIQSYLRALGIYSVGRYGAWGYGSMEDALLDGRQCARELNACFGQSEAGESCLASQSSS